MPVAVPHVVARDPPLLDAGDLVLDLVDREIERGLRLTRRRVRLHEVLLQVHGDLAQLTIGDTRVLQLGEVDLDAARVVGEASKTGHLLLRERLQASRDRSVLATNHDVHRHLASVGARFSAASIRRARFTHSRVGACEPR